MGEALKFGAKDNLPVFLLSLETALSSKLLTLHCFIGGGWGGGMNKKMRKRTVKTLSGKEKEI